MQIRPVRVRMGDGGMLVRMRVPPFFIFRVGVQVMPVVMAV